MGTSAYFRPVPVLKPRLSPLSDNQVHIEKR